MSIPVEDAMRLVPPKAANVVATLDGISIFVGKGVSWLAIPMMLSLIYEVVMRYFFVAPTIWAMDVSMILYGIHFMLGSPFCLQCGGHIRTDFFYHNWSVRTKAVVDVINYLLFFFPTHLLFFDLACSYFWKSFQQNEVSVTSPWMPVIWPLKLAIPVCVGLTLLQGTAEVLKCYYRWKTNAALWPTQAEEPLE